MSSTPMIRIDDLPTTLASACLNRGFDKDDTISPRDAVAEWSAWEIGDRFWGSNAVDLYLMALEHAPKGPTDV